MAFLHLLRSTQVSRASAHLKLNARQEGPIRYNLSPQNLHAHSYALCYLTFRTSPLRSAPLGRSVDKRMVAAWKRFAAAGQRAQDADFLPESEGLPSPMMILDAPERAQPSLDPPFLCVQVSYSIPLQHSSTTCQPVSFLGASRARAGTREPRHQTYTVQSAGAQ